MGKRMVVVGGVAGGASAAAKAKRENPELEVVVYEKSGWVSYGACGLPYVLSGEIPRLERLVARTPEEFRKQGVLVHTRHEVVDVDYELRTLTVHDHAEGRTFQDRFDHLVLATGARPSLPPIPGTEQVIPCVQTNTTCGSVTVDCPTSPASVSNIRLNSVSGDLTITNF